jgi:hypothetical protein
LRLEFFQESPHRRRGNKEMDGERLDGAQYEIPQSRGMPPPVRWFFAVGLIVIVLMGAISALESGHFHVWPVNDTVKIDLSNGERY